MHTVDCLNQTAVTRTVHAPCELGHGMVPGSERFASGCKHTYRVFGHYAYSFGF